MRLALTQLRPKLFDLWRDMPEGGKTIEVSHRRRIYKVTIKPTDQHVGAYKAKGIKRSDIKKTTCLKCGFIMINGICMQKH